MSKYNLTAEESLLIELTFIARDEERSHQEYFVRWLNAGGQDRLKSLFKSLQEKGVILKSYNPEKYSPNDIEFNKNFIRFWLKNSGDMGKELMNKYPSFVNIQGRYFPLKDVSKRFASLEEFYFFYGSRIHWNPEKHAEVLDILDWAIENNHINFGILNFTISEQWNSLKELRENPELVPIGSSFDIYESV